MSGKFISINPTDTTSVLRHDGTWFDTGSFADKTYVNNASGVLRTDLIATGSYLYGLIQASSAGVSSLNGRSGTMTLSGTGNVTVINSGQTLYISGNTGAYANFVYKGETGTFVTSDKTGSFVTTAMTGILVPTGATGNLVNVSQTGGFVAVNDPNRNLYHPGISFSSMQGDNVHGIWGGGFTNALTNWTRRGLFLTTLSSGGVTGVQDPQNTVEHLRGTQPMKTWAAINQTGSGTATFIFTGLGHSINAHAGFQAYVMGRLTTVQSDITGLMVEYQNNTGGWEQVFSGAPAWTGNMWIGPYVNVTNNVPIGVKFTLGTRNFSGSVSLAELGIWNKNYMRGSHYLALQYESCAFINTIVSGTLSVSGNASISGSPIITAGQTGTLVPTGLTGRFVTTGQTGNFVTTSMTGTLVPTGLTGIFVTTGQTGLLVNNFSTQNVSGNKSFYGFTSLIGGVQIYNGAYSDILYSISDTSRYADMFLAQLATGGIPILDWANRYLTGNWSVGGLRISGNQVITSAQTGDYVQTGESRPVNFTGPVTAGYINSTSGVFSTLNVGGSLTCTGPASFSTNFSVSGNGVVTSNMTGNFVTTSMTGILVPTGATGNFVTRAMTGVLVANNTSIVTTFNGGLINSGKNVLTNDPKFGVVFTTGNQTITGTKTFDIVNVNQLSVAGYSSFTGPVDMFDNLGVNGYVSAGAVLAPTITASVVVDTPVVKKTSTTLTYSGTNVVVNFPTRDNRFLTMTGDATFTGSNMADGYSVKIKLYASGAGYNLVFPTGWKFITSKPVSINPGKYAYLELDAWGTAVTDVFARYTEEP